MPFIGNSSILIGNISCIIPSCIMCGLTFHHYKPLILLTHFPVVKYIFTHKFNSSRQRNWFAPFQHWFWNTIRLWVKWSKMYYMSHRMKNHIFRKLENICDLPTNCPIQNGSNLLAPSFLEFWDWDYVSVNWFHCGYQISSPTSY